MAGRAGRPQFCSSATVVIMTEAKNKHKYEELMVGSSKVKLSLGFLDGIFTLDSSMLKTSMINDKINS